MRGRHSAMSGLECQGGRLAGDVAAGGRLTMIGSRRLLIGADGTAGASWRTEPKKPGRVARTRP